MAKTMTYPVPSISADGRYFVEREQTEEMDSESPMEGATDSEYQPHRDEDETHYTSLQQCPAEGATASQCQSDSSEVEIHPLISQQSPGKAAKFLESHQHAAGDGELEEMIQPADVEEMDFRNPAKGSAVSEYQSHRSYAEACSSALLQCAVEDARASECQAASSEVAIQTERTLQGPGEDTAVLESQHHFSEFKTAQMTFQLLTTLSKKTWGTFDRNSKLLKDEKNHSGRSLLDMEQLGNNEKMTVESPAEGTTASEFQPHPYEVEISPLRSQKNPGKGTRILASQHYSNEVRIPFLALQVLKQQCRENGAALERIFQLVKDAKDQIRYPHICNQCEQGFRWSSYLTWHKIYAHNGFQKAQERQSEVCGTGPLAENTLATSPVAFQEERLLKTDQTSLSKSLSICDHSRKDFKWPSALARHQQAAYMQEEAARQAGDQRLEEAEELGSIEVLNFGSPVEGNASLECQPDSSEVEIYPSRSHRSPGKETAVLGNQPHSNELQCEQDYRWPSHLAQDRRDTHSGYKATECKQSAVWKVRPLGSVSIPQQEKSTSANFDTAFHQASTLNPHKKISKKNTNICDHCGKIFSWPSDLARHRQRAYVRAEIARQQQKSSRARHSDRFIPLSVQESSTEYGQDPFASVPLKTGDAFTDLHNTLNLVTGQSSHKIHAHVCELCGKDFAWLSDLVQHCCVHFGETDRSNATQFMLASGPLQVDNSREPFCETLQTTEERHSAESCCDFGKESSTVFKLRTNKSKYPKKPYVCGLCGKGFQWISDLGRHKRTNSRKTLVMLRNYYFKKAYHCYQCGKCFQRPFDLRWHECRSCLGRLTTVRGNHFRKPYMCGWCGKSFQWFCKLAQHKGTSCRRRLKADQRNQLKKPYLCALCGKGFLWPCILSRHIRANCRKTLTTHSKKPYVCGQCGEGFRWLSNLGQHKHANCRKTLMIDQHKHLKKPYMCSQCGRSFQGLPDLGRHKGSDCRRPLMTHQNGHAKKPYSCGFCRKSFQWLSNLGRHKHANCGEELTPPDFYFRKPYKCFRCGRGFRWPSNLGWHQHISCRRRLLTDHGVSFRKPYACGRCGKSFQWLSSLGRHRHTYCSGMPVTDQRSRLKEPYACGRCGRSFQWLCKLVWHPCASWEGRQTTDQGDPVKKPYVCAPCGKSFQWPCNLGRHKRTNCRKLITDQSNHVKKPYICGWCGRTFQWLSNLDQHKHTDCKRMFITDQSNHFKRDGVSEEWPYGVAQGEAAHFEEEPLIKSSIQSISTLRQSSHTEKMYLCDQCGQSFQWLSGLTQHMYVHSGKQPYACATCGCRFRRRVQLVMHQKLHKEDQMNQHLYMWDDTEYDSPKEQCRCSMDFGKQCNSSSGLKAYECGMCEELLPENTVLEIGVNGYSHILSLP